MSQRPDAISRYFLKADGPLSDKGQGKPGQLLGSPSGKSSLKELSTKTKPTLYNWAVVTSREPSNGVVVNSPSRSASGFKVLSDWFTDLESDMKGKVKASIKFMYEPKKGADKVQVPSLHIPAIEHYLKMSLWRDKNGNDFVFDESRIVTPGFRWELYFRSEGAILSTSGKLEKEPSGHLKFPKGLVEYQLTVTNEAKPSNRDSNSEVLKTKIGELQEMLKAEKAKNEGNATLIHELLDKATKQEAVLKAGQEKPSSIKDSSDLTSNRPETPQLLNKPVAAKPRTGSKVANIFRPIQPRESNQPRPLGAAAEANAGKRVLALSSMSPAHAKPEVDKKRGTLQELPKHTEKNVKKIRLQSEDEDGRDHYPGALNEAPKVSAGDGPKAQKWRSFYVARRRDTVSPTNFFHILLNTLGGAATNKQIREMATAHPFIDKDFCRGHTKAFQSHISNNLKSLSRRFYVSTNAGDKNIWELTATGRSEVPASAERKPGPKSTKKAKPAAAISK